MTYVSARSVRETEFGVGEQYFDRVTDLRAEVDGRGVRGRQFATERTTPRDVFLSGGSVQSFRLDAAARPAPHVPLPPDVPRRGLPADPVRAEP